jgi:sirohydrochlorin cobaltochelatase
MKTQLVLFAHGSRDPRWRAPFLKLLEHLRSQEGEEAVSLAFMEFAPPTLVDVAKEAAQRGVQRILVDVAKEAAQRGVQRIRLLPLFLAGGAHVARDIPEQVGRVMEALPHMQVDVLPSVGEDPRFESLLREIIREHARPESPA